MDILLYIHHVYMNSRDALVSIHTTIYRMAFLEMHGKYWFNPNIFPLYPHLPVI